MASQKFGTDRFQPEGEWVQTSELVSVVGIQERKSNARKFANAVKTAEKKHLEYGVELELEPENSADPNAIKVIEFSETSGLLGRSKFQDWHIGYCDRELAAELHRDLLNNGIGITAELFSIFVRDDYFDIKFFVLGLECPHWVVRFHCAGKSKPDCSV